MAGPKGAPQLNPYKWKPGQSGNPGGQRKSVLTGNDVEVMIQKLMLLTKEQLLDVAREGGTSVLEMTVASIIAKAIEEGDQSRLEALLARAIGKLAEKVKIELPPPTVVERLDGSQIVAGIIDVGMEQSREDQTDED